MGPGRVWPRALRRNGGHFIWGKKLKFPSNSRPSADHGGADKLGRMLLLQTLGGGGASIDKGLVV